MMTVYCIDILGMGGWHLDPARGQLVIIQELHNIGVTVVPPFDPADVEGPVKAVQKLPLDATLIYVGDSCGANRFSWLQAEVPSRHWQYAALIQPSLYCNANCPPISASAKEVDVFYTSFLTWPLPGLGCYKPQPAVLPPGVARLSYPGRYVCNSGRTTICYIDQKTHVHPGDDQAGTQWFIVSKVKKIIAAEAAPPPSTPPPKPKRSPTREQEY
jgi:hypothetical protein